MRSVLFCNEILGLGHLKKALSLAGALVARDELDTALVVTGSHGHAVLAPPPRVDVMKLPAAPVQIDRRWPPGEVRQPAEMALDARAVLDLRARLALTVVQALAPEVVVVDHVPLGRGGDLRPALEWLRASTGASVALGLRDFDDAADVQSLWTTDVVQGIGELFDLAIIYGEGWIDDPRLEALNEAGMPVHRTGLLGMPAAPGAAEDLGRDYLLVTVGGGVDGFPLLAGVLDALDSRHYEHPTVLVTGPMMPAEDVARLRRRAAGLPARVEGERADMAAVMGGARAVVSMAGYGTVAEILGTGKPALLIPRVHPRKEQLGRARYWAAQGRMSMLDPRELSPAVLGDEIAGLLNQPSLAPLELTGASEASEILTLAAARS